MTIEDFIRDFEGNFPGLEAGTVKPETVFRDFPQWDSLAVLMTLAMIDADYEVSLTANELNRCNTIAELFELVQKKGPPA